MLVWKKLVGTALLFLLIALVAFGFAPASAQAPGATTTTTATVNANTVVTATATLTPTATSVPATATHTSVPPSATATVVPATATKTAVPPSATLAPATATQTRVLPTATVTKTLAPSATATKPAATATATKSATATKVPPTATSVPKAVAPRAGVVTSLSTMFAVQNTDPSTTANVTATFYDTAGTAVSTVNKTIAPNLSTTIDQRATGGGLDSFSSWQGSVVLSSNTQLAAVVNQYSGNVGSLGKDFRFDAYNGISSTETGTSVLLPQLLKGWFDPGTGTSWNNTIAIQNSNLSASANVTVTYKGIPPSPNLGTYTRTGISIPPGASIFIDTATDSVVPSPFYGSAVVTSNQPVAVAVNMNTAGVLNSYIGLVDSHASTTQFVPQVLRNWYDPGSNYTFNTSILVMSADGTAANVTVTYNIQLPSNRSIASTNVANPAWSFDQRYDPPLASQGTMYGSAVITADKPVVVIVAQFTNNDASRGLRSTYFRSLSSNAAGTTFYVPQARKNHFDAGTGISYGTSTLVQLMSGSSATVYMTYYRSDGTTISRPPFSLTSASPQASIDSRYDSSLSGLTSLPDAAIVITSTNPIGVLTYIFGNDPMLPGDSNGSYLGIRP